VSGIAKWSLKRRIFVTGLLVVGGFLLLAGIALEQAFRSSAEQARHDRLQSRLYVLMGMTEVEQNGAVALPDTLPDPELALPQSGSYANISGVDGTLLWQSLSSSDSTPEYPVDLAPGTITQFTITNLGIESITLSLSVIWELGGQQEAGLIFQAGESTSRVNGEVRTFRNTLQKWLGSAGIILLILQLLVLNWVIRPLRKVSEELHEVEAGEREKLSAEYPQEILQLSNHLNNLLKTNRSRLQRYRNSLSDLAHSLKTPLASARLTIESKQNNDSDVLEQLDHINTMINYQLQRASTSGRSPLTTSVAIEPAVKRVTKSLLKVFHDKGLQIDIDIAPDCQFKGDAGDLIEILGNLCENACKWAQTTIRISARKIETGPTAKIASVRFKIEDDGPGIPVTSRKEVFTRGMRADSRQPGQGIGLATVHEMVVEVYGGAIKITDSELGGAAISITI